MTGVPTKGGNLDTDTHRERMWRQIKNSYLLAKERGLEQVGPSLMALGESNCLYLDFLFLFSRTVRQYISIVSCTQFVVVSYRSSSKLIQRINVRSKNGLEPKSANYGCEANPNCRPHELWMFFIFVHGWKKSVVFFSHYLSMYAISWFLSLTLQSLKYLLSNPF